MSLINQMLQDLEKRRASSAERSGLPDQVRALPPDRKSRAWWLWWALGVGLAALITPAVMDWYQRDWPASKEARQSPAPPPPVPSAPLKPASDAGALEPLAPAPIAARLALELERVPPDSGTRVAADTRAPASSEKGARAQPPPAGMATLPRGEPVKRVDALSPDIARPAAAAPAMQRSTASETVIPAMTQATTSTSHARSALPQPAPTLKLAAPPGAPPSPAGKVTAAGQDSDAKTGAHPVTASTRTVLAPATMVASIDAQQPMAGASGYAQQATTSASSYALQATTSASGSAQQATTSANGYALQATTSGGSSAQQATPQIDKRVQQFSPQQVAENDYRKAIALLNQGRGAEAQDALRLALVQNPTHAGARQALFGLLLDAKKPAQAEQVLQDGLRLDAARPGFAMALARLQVERGDTATAVETLQKTAPAAHDSPDYLAFLAALLQRQARHQAAIDHYEAALRLAPNSGVWLMGLGISLQAVNRNPEAQSAFRRAKATNTLNPELQAFIDQRIRQLQ